MIEIIPAILPKSFSDLQEKMSIVSGIVPMVQVDVVDGVFAPNKTWPYVSRPDPDFTRILEEESGFPFWQELDFEVDLMIANPDIAVFDWIKAGTKRVILHLESSGDISGLIQKIREQLPVRDSFLYTEIGVAINPDTADEKLDQFLDKADFVQFMGIAKVGFQGQEFDTRVLEKIKNLRSRKSDVTISVDGGVNLETAPKLSELGVNRLVVGSAIFGVDDPLDALERFNEIAGLEN